MSDAADILVLEERRANMFNFLHGKRRALLGMPLAIVALGSTAQDYPSRPIQMLVPFAAGGGLDLNARNLADAMAQTLGQSIAVINRDGAAGTVGLTMVANARADGYVLAFTPAVPLSSERHRLKSIAYDLDSFRYVCQVFDNIFAIAVPGNSPYHGVEDILADARKVPGKVNYYNIP
ncbi:Bug family tripartite tricarboxylate transporter substrate binding protein [Variovorax sp. HW608]|uniref:Bug family tripartite tricarboxylate transporter substrate binding protein n=1 Tax=Variovorax sp. HW608 TaxID=1034889 RepID=UPI000B5AF494|nr:tripartite tricarboxylate transporter substrate-binding protein [Variovorax sp. HW608]